MNISDKANAAKRLQENDDYKLMMEAIEADIFRSFQTVKVGDDEALKQVHTLSLGFNLFKKQIAKYREQAAFEAQRDEDQANEESY